MWWPYGYIGVPVPDPPPPDDAEPATLPAPSKTTEERLAQQRDDGMACYRCGEFFQYASPNRSYPSGTITINLLECWACTQDPHRPGTKRRLTSD